VPSTWKPPRGWTLTKHDSYTIDARGFKIDAGPDQRAWALMPDGQIMVFEFNEDEPFTFNERGEGVLNGSLRPIVNGVVPAQYSLLHEDDATEKVEPASVLTGKDEA
jgi:hypothetical protein